MTEKTTQIVVNANLVAYLEEIVNLTKDGWELELNSPAPGMYGYLYEAHMTKTESAEAPKGRKPKAEAKKEE